MTIYKFMKRLMVKLAVYLVILFMITTVYMFIEPMLANELALGQMENSSEAFAMMSTFRSLKNIKPLLYFGIWALFAGTVAFDTYKFHKSKGENKT